MLESILFKHITLITPDGPREGDLLVKNGKIQAIDWTINSDAELIIQDRGLTLLPGVIDPHVHFREPGAEWKETIASGSKAAASGGVTSFFDMPNTSPSATTIDTINQKKQIASETSLINYNFFIGATPDNLHDINHVENVPGIKVFMGSSTGSLLLDDPDQLEQLFSQGKRLIAVHAEDEAMVQSNKHQYQNSKNVMDHTLIRPPEAALKATKLAVSLAKKHQRRLHICHLTTAEEAMFLDGITQVGLITTEVTPQHLLLYGPEIYDTIGTFAQINPPIRTKEHRDALWKALKKGVIQCIGTDHAPHTIEEKEKPFGQAPSGMPGVETSLSLMLNQAHLEHCSLNEIVHWMSTSPAMLYGIPNKGLLKVGYDADLVLVDTKAQHTITHETQQTKAKWSAFSGSTLTGLPIATFVNGQQVYREGDFFNAIKGQEIICEQTLSRTPLNQS